MRTYSRRSAAATASTASCDRGTRRPPAHPDLVLATTDGEVLRADGHDGVPAVTGSAVESRRRKPPFATVAWSPPALATSSSSMLR